MNREPVRPAELAIDHPTAGTILMRFVGVWRIDSRIPSVDEVGRQLPASGRIDKVTFDTAAMTAWDSGFLVFLTGLKQKLAGKGIHVDATGLPDGVIKILAIASAVPEKTETGGKADHGGFWLVWVRTPWPFSGPWWRCWTSSARLRWPLGDC